MKNLLLNLLFFFITSTFFAQIKFEKGYFVNNQGVKIECLIKNLDWDENPEKLVYKVDEAADLQEANINDVDEFKIFDTEHYYKRYTLTNTLKDKNFLVVKNANDAIFLKVLVEGATASLFKYNDRRSYFFYELENQGITYIEFDVSEEEKSKIKERAPFRKHLSEKLKCDSFTIKTFTKLKYTSTDLVNLFGSYNECSGKTFENLYEKRSKSKLRFKVMAILNADAAGSVKYQYTEGSRSVKEGENAENFDGQTTFSFGFETELVLPFNRRKWSLYVAPSFHKYEASSQSNSLYGQTYDDILVSSRAAYSYVEIPIGVRHYMFLNENFNLFAQAAYSKNIITSTNENRETTFEGNVVNNFQYVDNDNSNYNLSIGFGFGYKEHMALSLNYYFVKNVTGDLFNVNMNGTLSLNATYVLF